MISRFLFIVFFSFTFVSFDASWSSAFVIAPPSSTEEIDEENNEEESIVLPYAFGAEGLGLAYGIAGSGYKQYEDNQVKLFGALMGSTNSSYVVALSLMDYRLPWTKRFFIDLVGSIGLYTEQRAYTRGNLNFESERAGEHRSSEENFLEGEGWDNWLDIHFRYVLPIGFGRNSPLSKYVLNDGMLVSGASGGGPWNPIDGGVTILSLIQFAQRKSLKLTDGTEESYLSSGLKVELTYDNRDFPHDPSVGSALKIGASRDFGWPNTFNTWTFLEGEYTKYFSLGADNIFKQRVIALSVWAADTPTWQEKPDRIDNRPPPSHGASLGGFYRMRGYPLYRFHDRSALFYSAEARVTPHLNPLANISLLKYLHIDWWQVALFAEAGRVAGKWDFTELHEDMKFDAGIGFRMMVMRSVVRLDMAVSDEGFNAWAMVGHPF